MKLNTKRIIAATLLITAAGAHAWDSNENQIWLDGSLSGKISDKLSLKLGEQIRYKNEGDFFCYKHTDLCTAYKFGKPLTLSVGFRHMYTLKNPAASWANKEMTHVNAINTLSFAGMDFKTRMRFCYTEADNTDYLMDVRPLFCLAPSKGFTDWKLKPYISDEIMYNLNETHLYRNRVNLGLMMAPAKSLSLNFFIMHENTQKTEDAEFSENFNYGLFASCKF